MKKTVGFIRGWCKNRHLRKIWMTMGLSFVILVLSFSQLVASPGLSESLRFDLSLRNESVKDVMDEIESRTDYHFLYNKKVIDVDQTVSIDAKNQELGAILSEVFGQTDIEYTVIDRQIVLNKVPESATEKVVSEVAQSKSIKGIVKDQAGEPLIGVTVMVKGTTRGVITDLDGKYEIAVDNGDAILLFSFIGFQAQEIAVGNSSEINIELAESVVNVDEVVVVGYGQQKKESVTAAISTVAARELVQSPSANLSNALAGRLSGLTSIQTSGKPGEDDADLYVRGIGTYTGNTSPLIMVDGVARDSYNNIDPNEIESISILKDASATAVFGVRGANGVILITTKRGTQGAPKVSISAQTAVTRFTRLPEFVNAYDWCSLFNEKSEQTYWIKHANEFIGSATGWSDYVAQRDAEYSPGLTNWQNEATRYTNEEDLAHYKNHDDPYFYPDTDWQSMIFKKASRQSQYNVNVEGGTENVKYFVSLGYLDQGGMFNNDYLPFPNEQQYSKKRHNIRSNFDFDVNENFRISIDIGTNFEKITGMNNDSYMWNKRIMWANPISSPGMIGDRFVLINGKDGDTANNALYELSIINFNVTNNSTLNSSIKASHKLDFITKGLSINGRVAYDSYFQSQSGGSPGTTMLYRISRNPNGDVMDPIFDAMTEKSSLSYWSEWYNGKWRKIYGEASLNYNRSFGLHDVGGLVLFNMEKAYNPGLAYGLPHAYLGTVGRITYSFAKRYLAEFNVGYNGSENFPEGQRFGFLPAVSLGWTASNETFFPKNDFMTYLKIRGSVGKVGNDNIGGSRYLYLPDVWDYSGGYNFGDLNNRNYIQGAIEGTVGNPNVTWETATKSNIGFETRIFGDKLSISYDYFYEYRKDILSYKGTVPDIVQASLPPYNLGEVKNWGQEVEFNWRDKVGQFEYWVKGNASTNRNKIVYRDEAITPGLEYQAQTGKPIDQPSRLVANGLYNSWADLYEVDGLGNPILSSPKLAYNSKGETYLNAEGNPVYQKDLGYGGAILQPGEIRLVDYNEDGVIDDFDYVRTGKTSIPELTYGVSAGFGYKGFDFSLMFQGVSGVSRYVQTSECQHFSDNHSLQEVDLYRFTEARYAAGERIEMPIAAYNQSAIYNTYFQKDASYVRLKNLEIGYTFEPNFLKRAGINSARLYANGQNLLTWGKNDIWGDPENLGNTGYPITSSYNIGINVSF